MSSICVVDLVARTGHPQGLIEAYGMKPIGHLVFTGERLQGLSLSFVILKTFLMFAFQVVYRCRSFGDLCCARLVAMLLASRMLTSCSKAACCNFILSRWSNCLPEGRGLEILQI